MKRTGVEVIDQLIWDFQLQYPGHWDTYSKALNQCSYATARFIDFVGKREVPGLEVRFNGGSPKDTHPDALGYKDRTIVGCSGHCVAILTYVDEEVMEFMIDWTALQYGYTEYPLVQKRVDGEWSMDFEPVACADTSAA